jgi:hypothetical protein
VGRVTPRSTWSRGKQPHIPTEYDGRRGALLTVQEVWCLVGYANTSLYASPTRGRHLASDFTGTLNIRVGYVSALQYARERITIPGATNRQLTHNINYASSEEFIAPISTSQLQHVFANTLVDWEDFCPWKQRGDRVKVTTPHSQSLCQQSA